MNRKSSGGSTGLCDKSRDATDLHSIFGSWIPSCTVTAVALRNYEPPSLDMFLLRLLRQLIRTAGIWLDEILEDLEVKPSSGTDDPTDP
jgi:hypothetical protein